jgi:hypothetical protein
MPSFCAASMRRPRVLSSAVRISRASNWSVSVFQTSSVPASSRARATRSRSLRQPLPGFGLADAAESPNNSGGKSLASTICEGAITVRQWQISRG